MKRVAIYMRVSTAGQEDEETIESQLMELRERIVADGYVLVPENIYEDDGWTGSILERPALDQLRWDARDNKFDVVYFYDRGRIARKFSYQEVVLEELENLGIECISLHDVNGNSPEEKVMGGVMGIFHEYERVKMAERFRLGKMRKVRENKKLLGYNPAYGYDYHPRIKGGTDARDGYFTVNEQEAEVVRQVFQWVADGVPIRDVIRRLYENGIPPRKQKRMTWTKGPVARMLSNTSYVGKHYYNKSEAIETKNPKDPTQKYRRVKKGSRVARPKEEWLLIKVPRIVDDALFDKVQKQLEKNIKFSRRNNKKNEYLLTGLIDCECGMPRTGDPGANGNLYYRCTDRLSRFPLQRLCHSGGVNAQVLDTLVWHQVVEMCSNPQLIAEQADRWLASKNTTSKDGDVQTARKRLKELDASEKRYAKAYGLGYMAEPIYKEQMLELVDTRKTLQEKIARIKGSTNQKRTISREELIAGTQNVLSSLEITDKKAIIRLIVSKVKATQEKAIIWGHLPVQVKEVGFEPKHRYRRPA